MGYIEEPRPCLVDGAQALFHGFFNFEKPTFKDSRQVGAYRGPLAVVEYRNGDVDAVKVTKVRFLDSEGKFSQYCWGVADA